MHYSTSGHQLSQVNNPLALSTGDIASLANALPAIFADYVAANQPTPPASHPAHGGLRCDPELARVAVGLRQSAQLRVWMVIEQHARDTGLNYLTRDHLRTLLDRYGIRYTERTFNRWLRVGHSTYWRLHNDRIWLTGYRRLATALVNRILDMPKPKRGFDPRNLVLTNQPGYFKPVYINVASDNLHQFEAACYSAWHTAKGSTPISRYVLSLLFRRSPKVLRRWEKLAGVVILHTFQHYTGEMSHYIPLSPDGKQHRGGVIEYTVSGRKRWSAEFSNAYQTVPTRQHSARGQARKVARTMHELLESVQAAGFTAQIPYRDGRLHRTGRRLFHNAKRLRRAYDPNNPQEQYIYKGVDNRRCLHIECSADGWERTRLKACVGASKVLDIKRLV